MFTETRTQGKNMFALTFNSFNDKFVWKNNYLTMVIVCGSNLRFDWICREASCYYLALRVLGYACVFVEFTVLQVV